MHTYAVAITVDSVQYNFHIPSKDAVRDLIAGVTGQIQVVEMWEETHTGFDISFRKMERSEVAALCNKAQYAVLAHV